MSNGRYTLETAGWVTATQPPVVNLRHLELLTVSLEVERNEWFQPKLAVARVEGKANKPQTSLHTHTHTHTHTRVCLPVKHLHKHTHTFSLYFSLKHTHTHTHTDFTVNASAALFYSPV